MIKNTSLSIRIDSQLKEQTESVLKQFGLNMTTVVTMLFHQIVREQEIPLSLSLKPRISAIEELGIAARERKAGYSGRAAGDVADSMEQISCEAANARKKTDLLSPPSLKTKGWKFNREDANER